MTPFLVARAGDSALPLAPIVLFLAFIALIHFTRRKKGQKPHGKANPS